MTDSRRSLPSIDRLVRHQEALRLIDSHGRSNVVAALRDVLQNHRTAGATEAAQEDALLSECAGRLARQDAPSLRPVLNLSGTVLHTNLGRACLPASAARAAMAAMTGATNLEFDLESGARGERDDHIEELLCRLTGAEAATVVNNNAAAVMLALNTVALRKEVIVSRGELVEIGGAFRVPDVMSRAGCKLREIGTTNRTHLRDYEAAIGERTAAVDEGPQEQLCDRRLHVGSAAAGSGSRWRSARGIPFLIDLGSGSLIDLRAVRPAGGAHAAAGDRRWGERSDLQRRQAARRPAIAASSSAARRWSAACAPIRSSGRCGSTRSSSPRWRRRCGSISIRNAPAGKCRRCAS